MIEQIRGNCKTLAGKLGRKQNLWDKPVFISFNKSEVPIGERQRAVLSGNFLPCQASKPETLIDERLAQKPA